MRLSIRSQYFVIWLALGSLAAASSSLTWPAAHYGAELLPVGNDSFYHARRILDTVEDPRAFYEFDDKIHAPEGSLLTWPWGYDFAMAQVARLGMALGLSDNPMAILIWIPVIAVFGSIGFLVLAARRLQLSAWATVLAGLCVALSPLTQYLHGAGFIDHHFAEYMMVLAAVALGMTWLGNLSSRRAAVLLGVALGIAPAIHNGLFILQLPLLVALFISWMRNARAQLPATEYFSGTLLLTTVLVAIPSLPFRQGLFEYYYLSWFHVYVALATAGITLYLTKVAYSTRNLLLLLGIGALLLLPLGYQITMGRAFLSGTLTRLDMISEMFSVPRMIRDYGPYDVSSRYSLFIWLVPATLLICTYRLWQERELSRIFFWICSLSGTLLLLLQFRLHYFGSFALYLPWILALDEAGKRLPQARTKIMLMGSLACLLLYAPPLRTQLLGPMMHANEIYFLNLRPMLKTLTEACKEDPGIVLADNDIGHLVRYYTDCSVIANNFLLTEQHGKKIQEMDRLMATPADQLTEVAPYVKYVIVRPAYIDYTAESGLVYVGFSPLSGQLVADLLLKPFDVNDPVAPPPGFQLLHTVRVAGITEDGEDIPYARLYKLQAAPTS